MLQHDGIEIPQWNLINDTHIMSFLHDNQEPIRKLKVLAQKFLGIDARKGEILLNALFKKTGWNWKTVPIDTEIYWQYAALDAVITSGLASILPVGYYPKNYDQAYDLEMAAVKVLMKMWRAGFAFDSEYANHLLQDLLIEKDTLVHLNSDSQWCMNETGIRISFKEDIINYFTSQNVLVPVKTTKKGNTSIDDSVLEKIQHPHAKEIQRARKLKTWIDNYVVKMIENDDNGVIRPHINPLGGEHVGS